MLRRTIRKRASSPPQRNSHPLQLPPCRVSRVRSDRHLDRHPAAETAEVVYLAQGKTTARNWALNKVSDSKANYFTVTYVNDNANGQAYPSRIDYTGNSAANLAAYNSVQFVYATRPDVSPQYQAGSLMKTSVRLTNVKTFTGSILVADYRRAYQRAASELRYR
jgi:hypothetical protein